MFSRPNFSKKCKKNKRKALVRVLEIDSSDHHEKEVRGFGVKTKTEENVHVFITSCSVLNSPLCHEGSKLVAERYCSQYPNHIHNENHRGEVDQVISSINYRVSIVFFKGHNDEEFLEIIEDDTLKNLIAKHDKLYAYAFEGKKVVQLTLDPRNGNKLKSVSKEGFQVKRAKGAPIIVYHPCSEKPMIAGILDIESEDGNLYPVFLTDKTMGKIISVYWLTTDLQDEGVTHSLLLRAVLQDTRLDCARP
ncbi:uncharacterized protein LOC116297241 [Actinia tenebrosa]|uniref:Uncharacterized protein LOC116297241 n=1 Tax=Actinia tenebrosa TaxID=6105 RepID=A0A6P8I893_ACTTE|nr:uncharacterized protein LOC116297241 [Actinia tenebrosa]